MTITDSEPLFSSIVITSIEYPQDIKLGDSATIRIYVKNIGNYTVKKARLSFIFPTEAFGNISDYSVILSDIEPNHIVSYQFTINCTEKGDNTFIVSLDGIYSQKTHNSTVLSVYDDRSFFFDIKDLLSISILSFGIVMSFVSVKKGKLHVTKVRCHSCGAKLEKPNAEYCKACGTPVTKVCMFCEQDIPLAAQHCRFCGMDQEIQEPKKEKIEKKEPEKLFPKEKKKKQKKEKKPKKVKKEKKKTPKSPVKPLIIEDGIDITHEKAITESDLPSKKTPKKKKKKKPPKKDEKTIKELFST